MKSKTFKEYNPSQPFLLPPDLKDWLPENHLARFIDDLVETALELSAIFDFYDRGSSRGQPPYHPKLMVKIILYGYCTGKVSSRKLEKATVDEVPYRVLAGNQHPDHDSIADFRKRHLKDLSGLFLQVLQLCQKAGLVKLGRVALDGTKIKANASKHKAMSYERMLETEKRLREEVAKLLEEAEKTDAAEDAQFGKGNRGDELPKELERRESRLKKIGEAKAELEAEAKEKAAVKAREVERKLTERERKEAETGKKIGGKPPEKPDPEKAIPDPKAQKNFTDPESRIMLDGATKGFVQAFNAQIVVDAEAQIIVAAALTQEANDKKQLVPMAKEVRENLGCLPQEFLGDAGYFSEAAILDESIKEMAAFVPPDRLKHDRHGEALSETPSKSATVDERMRAILSTSEGREVYKERKVIVEPVFGQVKEVRGFRRFSFRGFENVAAEWDLVCLTHNILKLFRSGWQPIAA